MNISSGRSITGKGKKKKKNSHNIYAKKSRLGRKEIHIAGRFQSIGSYVLLLYWQSSMEIEIGREIRDEEKKEQKSNY